MSSTNNLLETDYEDSSVFPSDLLESQPAPSKLARRKPSRTRSIVSAQSALRLGRMQIWWDIKSSAPLFVGDFLSVVLAVAVAFGAATLNGSAPAFSIWPFGVLMVGTVLFFQSFHGLYPASGMTCAAEFSRGLRTCLSVAVVAGIGLLLQSPVNAVWLPYAVFVTMMTASLSVMRPVVRRIFAGCNWWAQPVVLLGNCKQTRDLHNHMQRCRHEGLRPLSVVVIGSQYWKMEEGDEYTAVFLRSIGELESIMLQNQVCRIAVTPLDENTRAAYQPYQGIPHVMMLTGTSQHPVSGIRLQEGVSGVELHCRSAVTLPSALLLKRAMDLTLVIGSMPFWAPVMFAIAFWLKLVDRGPIFYRQKRVGRFYELFHALKFRSMVVDADAKLKAYLDSNPAAQAEWDKTHKLKDDPRVTWLGRFLRKSSLDELPQLLNVLMGDMSLVGPRPIIDCDKYDREYIEEHPEVFDLYQMVRPGITGLWQISGRNQTTYKQRVYYDRIYLHNWTFAMDLYILWRTVKTAICREGAY